MANPPNADQCLITANPGDLTLKDYKSTPAWWAYCIGGTGVVNVYFFDQVGEIEGAAQTINVVAETGIMGLPGIVFPIAAQPAQGVAQPSLPRAIWMEIIAVSGTLTWGLYGRQRDDDANGTFLKAGSHRSYSFKNAVSLRLGPAPSPRLGTNGAVEVDEDASTSPTIITPQTPIAWPNNGAPGAETTHGLAIAGAGHRFLALMVESTDAAICWFQIWDNATDLQTGTLLWECGVSAGSATAFGTAMLTPWELMTIPPQAAGLAWGLSSTKATFTAVATPGNFTMKGSVS